MYNKNNLHQFYIIFFTMKKFSTSYIKRHKLYTLLSICYKNIGKVQTIFGHHTSQKLNLLVSTINTTNSIKFDYLQIKVVIVIQAFRHSFLYANNKKVGFYYYKIHKKINYYIKIKKHDFNYTTIKKV